MADAVVGGDRPQRLAGGVPCEDGYLAVFGVLADVRGLAVLANKLTIAHPLEILRILATL
jgi:hypothetical protein